MARLTGAVGSLTFYTSLCADYNTWRLNFSHPVDDDTSFSDTGTGASKSGCGTADIGFGCTGFLKRSAATTAPGWGGATSSIADADGASLTFTAFTGCSEAGTGILSGGAIDFAKRRGTAPVSYDGSIDGDLTETWATS